MRSAATAPAAGDPDVMADVRALPMQRHQRYPGSWWRPVQAVSFDGDQTLWDFEAAQTAGLLEVSRLFWKRVGATVSVDDLHEARRLESARNPRSSHEVIRRLSLERVLREQGENDAGLVEEAYARYMTVRHREVKCYPDAGPCLLKLRSRGYKLALTTNGNTRYRELGLPPFDAVTVGQADGVNKPSPSIYELACKRLSVCPSAVVHVGDDASEDYQAASQAGLRVWLICRDRDMPSGYLGGRTLREFLVWLGHR